MAIWRWVLAVFFCIFVGAVLGYVKYNQIQAAIAFGASFPEPSETVEAQVVQSSQWQPLLRVNGEILATRSLTVRNELEGMITKVGFTSGGQVKAGDVLLQFDITDEKAQLDAIKAEIRIAQLDVNRFSKLLESKVSSKDQLDRAKAQLAVTKARARSLEAVIAKKTITAPFDASAGLHELEVGTYLSANSQVTRLVSSKDEVWIDFSVAQEFAGLAVGDEVIVSSSTLLQQEYIASVIGVSQEIQVDSRNLRARALWTDTPDNIKPGALVDVALPMEPLQTVVKLPSVAIRYDAFGTYVYVLNKDDKGNWRASRQPISVGPQADKVTIVTAGLELGSTVATIGSSKLSEGLLVNVAAGETGNLADE